MPLPPEDSDFGKPISNDLSREIMQAFMRLPGPLQAQFEGKEGPVELPPEQQAEAFQGIFWILLKYMQTIAGRIDMLYHAVREIEEKVAKLEER